MAEEKSFEETNAAAIAEKIAAGLRREQAVEIVRAQADNDAAQKKSKKSEKPV